jgi:hypothetical protein
MGLLSAESETSVNEKKLFVVMYTVDLGTRCKMQKKQLKGILV